MLSRKKPTASQTYNSFRISSKIASIASNRQEAFECIKDSYSKAMSAAIQFDDLAKNVPLLPPARDMWSWDESLALAVSAAREITAHCVMILVPEGADIHVGAPKFGNPGLSVHVDADKATSKKSWLSGVGSITENNGRIVDAESVTEAVGKIADAYRECESARDGKQIDDYADGTASCEPNKKNNVTHVVDEERARDDMQHARASLEDSVSEFYRLVLGHDVETFAELLSRLMTRRMVITETLSVKSNIPVSRINDILSGVEDIPDKNVVAALGIGLGLTRRGVDKLLAKCGYAFSDLILGDVIIAWCMEHGQMGIDEINKALLLCGLEPLGAINVERQKLDVKYDEQTNEPISK